MAVLTIKSWSVAVGCPRLRNGLSTRLSAASQSEAGGFGIDRHYGLEGAPAMISRKQLGQRWPFALGPANNGTRRLSEVTPRETIARSELEP